MKRSIRYLVLTALLALCGASSVWAQSRTPQRSSFDLAVPWSPSPVKMAGQSQLVYELHMTNEAATALALKRIEVVDATTGVVLADFQGAPLQGLLGRIDRLSAQADRRLIPPGVQAVAYLSLPLKATPPRALRHIIEYEAVTDSSRKSATVSGGDISVREEPAASLGPPLRGGPWAAIYDASWERGHRRAMYAVNGKAHIPGRFAIDWIRLDKHGRYTKGDSAQLANWYGYGAEVLAVADATVVAACDDIAEAATVGAAGAQASLENASGNYIALDLGGGRYAFYEHLKPGSLHVKPGEHVRRGQVIAQLGYTGESTGPHLHFHVADNNAPLDAEGVPYAFDRFTLLGAYGSIDAFTTQQHWLPLSADGMAIRHDELPAPLAVVEFPAK